MIILKEIRFAKNNIRMGEGEKRRKGEWEKRRKGEWEKRRNGEGEKGRNGESGRIAPSPLRPFTPSNISPSPFLLK
ncbi:MAG: hypothetical protein HY738_14600 [Bacteroidia bacterium]|nr:hypothetical protein [Bacteroidia bacterium]